MRLEHAAGGDCTVICSSIAISSSCESLLCSEGLEIRFNCSSSILGLLLLGQHGCLGLNVSFLSQLLYSLICFTQLMRFSICSHVSADAA